MDIESLRDIFGKKRTIEILNLLAEEGTLNYSGIEDRIETSSDTILRSLDTLREYGLVDKIEKSSKDVQYSITEEGEEFLKLVEELVTFIATGRS